MSVTVCDVSMIMSVAVCDVSMVMSVTVGDVSVVMSVTSVGGRGYSGCKFLPLYTSTLLLDRVSQKVTIYIIQFSLIHAFRPNRIYRVRTIFSQAFFTYVFILMVVSS